MTTSEILLEAADLIERHGWQQGRLGNPECGFCAGGAINYVIAPLLSAVLDGAEAHTAFSYYLYSKGLSSWSHQKQVVTTLREAAL